LAIVNSYILLSSCGGKKISHRDFSLTIIREMLARSGQEPQPSMPVRRPDLASTNIRRLDTCHNKHWPGRNPKQWHCHMCSARGVARTVLFKCVKCDALCVDQSCFEDYLLTYLLTPSCRVLPEKLTGLQLVKKFPAFHGT